MLDYQITLTFKPFRFIQRCAVAGAVAFLALLPFPMRMEHAEAVPTGPSPEKLFRDNAVAMVDSILEKSMGIDADRRKKLSMLFVKLIVERLRQCVTG